MCGRVKGQTSLPRLFAQTQNDVWVHHKQIQDFKVGAVDLNLFTPDSPGSPHGWVSKCMSLPQVTWWHSPPSPTGMVNRNLSKKTHLWKTKARLVICRRMLTLLINQLGTKMNQAQDTLDIPRRHVGVARITIVCVLPMCFAAKEQSSAVYINALQVWPRDHCLPAYDVWANYCIPHTSIMSIGYDRLMNVNDEVWDTQCIIVCYSVSSKYTSLRSSDWGHCSNPFQLLVLRFPRQAVDLQPAVQGQFVPVTWPVGGGLDLLKSVEYLLYVSILSYITTYFVVHNKIIYVIHIKILHVYIYMCNIYIYILCTYSLYILDYILYLWYLCILDRHQIIRDCISMIAYVHYIREGAQRHIMRLSLLWLVFNEIHFACPKLHAMTEAKSRHASRSKATAARCSKRQHHIKHHKAQMLNKALNNTVGSLLKKGPKKGSARDRLSRSLDKIFWQCCQLLSCNVLCQDFGSISDWQKGEGILCRDCWYCKVSSGIAGVRSLSSPSVHVGIAFQSCRQKQWHYHLLGRGKRLPGRENYGLHCLHFLKLSVSSFSKRPLGTDWNCNLFGFIAIVWFMDIQVKAIHIFGLLNSL